MMTLKPILTEKSNALVAKGVYPFWVNLTANKPQIAKAVADFYQVKVEKVRTLRRRGERRVLPRFRKEVKSSERKLAYVTLAKGQKIEVFSAAKG